MTVLRRLLRRLILWALAPEPGPSIDGRRVIDLIVERAVRRSMARQHE